MIVLLFILDKTRLSYFNLIMLERVFRQKSLYLVIYSEQIGEEQLLS